MKKKLNSRLHQIREKPPRKSLKYNQRKRERRKRERGRGGVTRGWEQGKEGGAVGRKGEGREKRTASG